MPRRTRAHQPRTQRRKTVQHGNGRHRSNDFRCAGCRLDVPIAAPGSAHRNHCPNCLVSLHLDRRTPGDRASECRGRMEALALTARRDGEWMLIHRCRSCADLSINRIAGDDNALVLLRLAVAPLRDPGLARRALAADPR
ncbi:RNHCP domain-containing protein [Leucobacter allii]|uniref:RNHCP domain-containing protein n=1 Tax=Leucobacter allii TaxID=2932247 RepID=UPI001FD1BCC9|nr:RNHCP domain-containing protein [Leucobacter allii]UOR02571.1 RNHCP domain-containing protein [Leucobacter allii]